MGQKSFWGAEYQGSVPGSEQVLGIRCPNTLGREGVPDPQSVWESVVKVPIRMGVKRVFLEPYKEGAGFL